jgi:hypothetical protein
MMQSFQFWQSQRPAQTFDLPVLGLLSQGATHGFSFSQAALAQFDAVATIL